MALDETTNCGAFRPTSKKNGSRNDDDDVVVDDDDDDDASERDVRVSDVWLILIKIGFSVEVEVM